MPIFWREYTYKLYGLFSKKKKKQQRVRQQYIFAARGDITHFRHREMRWEGLIMISKQINTVFGVQMWDAIMQPLLCMNQEYISALKSERLPLFWYTLIIYTVYIWKDRHRCWVIIEIHLKLIDTVVYQNALWHGSDCFIFHIC